MKAWQQCCCDAFINFIFKGVFYGKEKYGLGKYWFWIQENG